MFLEVYWNSGVPFQVWMVGEIFVHFHWVTCSSVFTNLNKEASRLFGEWAIYLEQALLGSAYIIIIIVLDSAISCAWA